MNVVIAALGGMAGALAGWWLAHHPQVVDPRGEESAWPLPGAIALALTAGVVAALSLRTGHHDLGPGILSAVFAIALVTLAGTDFKRHVLPNRVTYPLIAAALAFAWAWPDRSIVDALVGGAVGVGISIGLIALSLLASGGRNPGAAFGIGDMKLIVLLGVLLGWPLSIRALLLGTALGGVAALVALIRSGRGQAIAYGPYLIAGGLFVLLWPGAFG